MSLRIRALSIRQPYAELILRGEKVIEYRSRATRIIGEKFYIYASTQPVDDIVYKEHGFQFDDLPTGVLVGTAKIARCEAGATGAKYQWHLTDVRRLKRHRRPKGRPQPIWFYPF